MHAQTPELIKLGLQIRKLRKVRKHSLIKLGVMCNVAHSHLCNLEQGKVNPSYLLLCRLAVALNYDLDDILDF